MPCSLLSRVFKTPHFNEYYKIPLSNVVCYDDPILYDPRTNTTELACASNMNWKICAEICWNYDDCERDVGNCCYAFAVDSKFCYGYTHIQNGTKSRKGFSCFNRNINPVNGRPATPEPTDYPTAFPTRDPTSYPTPYPTPLPTLNPDKVWCEAGKRWEQDKEICIPCRSGRYNHGGMHFNREWCYNIPPNEPFMYLNITDVQCRPYWYGIPQYHNGEYEFGCIDCPNGQCPTFSPTTHPIQPSFLPSIQPSFLPSTYPSFLPSTHPSFLPSTHPSFLPSTHPSFLPSTHPSLTPTQSPLHFSPFISSPPTASRPPPTTCKIGSCGGACCVSLIVIFGICVSGMIAFLIKKYIRRRVRNIGVQGIAMTQIIPEEEQRLPPSDSLRVVIPSPQS